MSRIIFHDLRAFTPFYSMAEGIEDNERDDIVSPVPVSRDAIIGPISHIVNALGDVPNGAQAPVTVEIPDDAYTTAAGVLENCLDNRWGPDRREDCEDEEDHDTVFPGEVEIVP